MRDGRIRHVRGDRAHPVSRGRLCRKCATAYNGVILDAQARLTTPLRRNGPKGAGAFVAVSWEEALAEIAERLRAIPGESVLNAHYTGTFALLGYHFPQRFFNRLGATEVDPDTICNKAGHVALDYLFGTSTDGFDPRTARDAAAILVWGANPSASAPHQHEHWLGEAPGAVIVVDPVRTPTARRGRPAPRPVPGSDAALAFALAHVIARDGLLDRELLTRARGRLRGARAAARAVHARVGRGRDRRAVRADRGGGAPLRRGALAAVDRPGLPAPAARRQRRSRGRALAALSGNLGRPGTGVLYLNGARSRALDEDYVAGVSLRRPEMPEPVSHMDLVDRLGDRARQPRPLLLEHQHRRVQPRADPPARRARPRGPLHGRDRSLRDRHHRLRRHRAAGGELPRMRRHRRLLLPPLPRRTGEGRGAARRRAAQHRDLPPPRHRHGLRGARTARARRPGHRDPPRPDGHRASRRSPRPARSGRPTSRRSNSPTCAFRRPAGASSWRASVRPPTDSRASRSRTPIRARAPACCACSPRPPPGSSTTPSPTTASSRGASAPPRSRCTPPTPRSADSPRATTSCSPTAPDVSPSRSRSPTCCRAESPTPPRVAGPSSNRQRANVNVLNPGDRSDMGDSTTVHGVEVTLERA